MFRVLGPDGQVKNPCSNILLVPYHFSSLLTTLPILSTSNYSLSATDYFPISHALMFIPCSPCIIVYLFTMNVFLTFATRVDFQFSLVALSYFALLLNAIILYLIVPLSLCRHQQSYFIPRILPSILLSLHVIHLWIPHFAINLRICLNSSICVVKECRV